MLLHGETSNLDYETAEHLAKTVNALKGKVTMLFITHALPKALVVDDVIRIGVPGLIVQSSSVAGAEA